MLGFKPDATPNIPLDQNSFPVGHSRLILEICEDDCIEDPLQDWVVACELNPLSGPDPADTQCAGGEFGPFDRMNPEDRDTKD